MKADDEGKCLFCILTLGDLGVTQGQGQMRNFLCISPYNQLVVRIILMVI